MRLYLHCCCRHVITQVIQHFGDGAAEIPHHKLKGLLFIATYPSLLRYVVYKWDVLAQVTVHLVALRSNERKSVQSLVSRVFSILLRECRPLAILADTTPEAFAVARQLYPLRDEVDSGFATSAVARREEKRAARLGSLNVLVTALTNILADSDTHWRYEFHLANIILGLLHLHQLPASVAALFSRLLAHDSLHLRKVGVRAVNELLARDKVRMLKTRVAIKPDGAGGVAVGPDHPLPPGTTDPTAIAPLGPRADNLFCWFETEEANRFQGKDECVPGPALRWSPAASPRG